jgi:hypothetical protein
VSQSTAAYAGRKVDVAAFALDLKTGALTPTIAANGSGDVTAGWYALANRFAVELFTGLGSIPFAAERGCDFLTDARANRWRTSVDVRQSFYSALVEVSRNLRGEEDDDDPDDERYDQAELQDLVVTRTTVNLTVDLKSRAGENHVFIAPIAVIPGGSR